MHFEPRKRNIHRRLSRRAISQGYSALGLAGAVAVLVLLAAFLVISPGSAGATSPVSKTHDGHVASSSEQTQTQVAVEAQTAAPTQIAGRWETDALAELADSLGWPTVVTQDDSGRLSISLVLSSTDHAEVSIRPFDFSAGAQAAFQAEQQDALVAGFVVTPGQFNSYSSYTATSNGLQPNERRLHWVAEQWIMGVDISGESDVMQGLDQQAIGDRLLGIAIEHGLTPPPGWTATAIPTQVQPSATPTTPSCDITFQDVTPDYWAYTYVQQLACSGIISGYPDGTFKPQNPTTRAQLTKMIVLSEGWTLANPDTPSFVDVDSSHLFYRYVETAFAHGVVHGYAGGLFKPDAYVTRAEVAKMLVLARGWDLTVQAPYTLCDVSTDHWAWTYVQIALQHGTFTGYANGCFLPDAFATRAQLAKVIIQSHE
jgi:hypothetical protein